MFNKISFVIKDSKLLFLSIKGKIEKNIIFTIKIGHGKFYPNTIQFKSLKFYLDFKVDRGVKNSKTQHTAKLYIYIFFYAN